MKYVENAPIRLGIQQLIEFTGLSESTIRRKINKNEVGYDPTFPTPIKVSARKFVWDRAEISAWLESKKESEA